MQDDDDASVVLTSFELPIPSTAPSICLTMILTDYHRMIERSLRSVSPWVHSFMLINNGSTEETLSIAIGILSQYGLHGEVLSAPLPDALHNAASKSSADYMLIWDLELELHIKDPHQISLTSDAYIIQQSDATYDSYVVRLVRRSLLSSSEPTTVRYLSKEYIQLGTVTAAAASTLKNVWASDHSSSIYSAARVCINSPASYHDINYMIYYILNGIFIIYSFKIILFQTVKGPIKNVHVYK